MNKLFPPVVESYLPAFLASSEEGCRVRFKVSDFTTPNDIKAVHMTVTMQDGGQSVLKKDKYPSGMIESGLSLKIENTDYYYVDLTKNDLEAGAFELNTFYRIQLRFSKVISTSNEGFNNQFLEKNRGQFSDWSSICLIRPIDTPILTVEGMDNTKTEIYFNAILSHIKGTFNAQESSTTELLYSYRIILADALNQVILDDSGEIFAKTGENTFKYNFKAILEDYVTYRLEILYNTTHGYQGIYYCNFQSVAPSLGLLQTNFSATPNRLRGSIKLDINSSQGLSENIMIRRSSNKNLFKVWEDVHLFWILSDKEWKYSWEDFSVEPGVVYKYAIQIYDEYEGRQLRGKINKLNNEVESISLFEDIYLYDGDKQLRIKYNPEITSFKYVVSESKTETLGSEFPYFVRGALTNYRTFSISGLITYKCDDYSEDYPLVHNLDDNDNFVGFSFSKENTPLFYNLKGSVSKNSKDEYIVDSGNGEAEIYRQALLQKSANYNNDYETFLEKTFRDEVMKFLYDGKVKLFKSETEGNILIRLTDVSLAPENQLGRKIYKFSATATEIAKPTLDNFKKYGIIKVNNFNNNLSISKTILGQLKNLTYSNYNVLNSISNKAKKETINTITTLKEVNWIRIFFNSKPYPINNNVINSFKKTAVSESIREDGYKDFIKNTPIHTKEFPSFLGYLIKITTPQKANGTDNQDVDTIHIVNQNGVFEISDEEISNIKKIAIYTPRLEDYGSTPVLYPLSYDIDFIAKVETKENREKKVANSKPIFGISQLWGLFKNGVQYELIQTIKNKHSMEWNEAKESEDYQKNNLVRHFKILEAINAIEIEASPGTVVKFKDTSDVLNSGGYFRHVIGDTGYYHIYNPLGGVVTGCYFDGVRLVKSENQSREIVGENEFKIIYFKDDIYNGLVVNSKGKSLAPLSQVYYKNKWRDIYEVEYLDENNVLQLISFQDFIENGLQNSVKIDDIVAVTISCPIEASINYYYELSEGEYQRNESK